VDVSDYAGYDATGLVELIRAGDVTVGEVAGAALDAHQLTDAGLGAVVEIYADFATDARELPVGPLHGVPFLTKDVGPNFGGRPLEFGSRLCAGMVAEHDSAYGRLVKETGVNLLGRTNTPEYSMALCAENKLYGATSNPWRTGCSTSGSSGGSAAAVAAGVVPIAHASDMGGSTRGPAAWCGTVGLQPSRGRVSAGPARADSGHGMAQSFVVTRIVRNRRDA
jgi:amidase